MLVQISNHKLVHHNPGLDDPSERPRTRIPRAVITRNGRELSYQTILFGHSQAISEISNIRHKSVQQQGGLIRLCLKIYSWGAETQESLPPVRPGAWIASLTVSAPWVVCPDVWEGSQASAFR